MKGYKDFGKLSAAEQNIWRAHWRRKGAERRARHGRPKLSDLELHRVAHHEPPSTAALAERERALAAPQTLTAVFCGDPPPGRSALDQRGECV
jgi:hypothetical protein